MKNPGTHAMKHNRNSVAKGRFASRSRKFVRVEIAGATASAHVECLLNAPPPSRGNRNRGPLRCAVLIQACFSPAWACIRPAPRAAKPLNIDGIERNISMALALSVVVPVKDEEENVAPLAHEIASAIAAEGDAEIIFVDDGSADATASVLKALKSEIPALRVIQHGRNIGQSRAIRTGVRAARSEIIVTLDGDGQNDPADIPKLLAVLRGPAAERIGHGLRRAPEPQGRCEEEAGLRPRQPLPPRDAAGRRPRHGLRAQGLPPRGLSGAALFRQSAPLPDRADAARGL